MVSTPEWKTLICTGCGYFENHLTKKEWLEKIKAGGWNSWKRAE